MLPDKPQIRRGLRDRVFFAVTGISERLTQDALNDWFRRERLPVGITEGPGPVWTMRAPTPSCFDRISKVFADKRRTPDGNSWECVRYSPRLQQRASDGQ